MTDKQIDELASKIAELVLDGIIQQADGVYDTRELQEQSLLTQLATAMTELDYNLDKENYSACEKLKKKIIEIEKTEDKLKNYK